MSWDQFLLMRHELVLLLIVLVVISFEIFSHRSQRKQVVNLAILLFTAHTIYGFFPAASGELFGGMYKTSLLHLLMKNILNVGVLIILLQSADWLKNKEDNFDKIPEYFILMLSTLIGMNFMISSGHFLMFYLGLELATIPIAALAAFERNNQNSAEAGIKLILSSALASGITLFGISFIYAATGSLYYTEAISFIREDALQVMALIFFFAGLAFKISIVPFHLWTADVYEGAPVNVTSYLSVISKGAAVMIFIILAITLFGALAEAMTKIVYVTSILTMTIGNLFAIRQTNLKRFLAFSSIAQAGFIFVGVVAGTKLGFSSVVYFVLVYIFSNLGAFGVVSAISAATGKENLKDYNGLYKTNPRLSLVMLLSLFSLAGIPPVAGFFGKFFLFTAAAQQGYYLLVLIAVINATVSLYYYLLVVKAMFINTNDNPIEKINSPWQTRISLLLCVGGIIAIGFLSGVYEHIFDLSLGY